MRYTEQQLAEILKRQGHEVTFPVPKARKKPSHEESRSQQAVITWWHGMHRSFGIAERMLFAVPNGGWRGKVTAAIMKREGVRAGTSDLILLAKRGPYGALCIEMKKPTGVVSDEQSEFLCEATKAGYYAVACYSTPQAVNVITHYLTKPEELF